MASSPLSQTTDPVIKTINDAQEKFRHAKSMVDNIHDDQRSILGTQWHGDSATRYSHDSETLHADLSELIQKGLNYCDEALTNVQQTANAAHGG